MAFIDEIKFHIKAGRGGNGVVRWRREKFIDKGGPNGGDGGRGGNVYLRAIRDVHILSKYRHQKEFVAENGHDGEGGSRHGRDGEDLYIDLPIGSIITQKGSDTVINLEKEGQKVKILKGGSGGFGNEHFKSSTNVTPKEATKGKFGEEGGFDIELQLFADIGFIGLPNAGKSSLLNSLTNAQAKIGSYAFTTLDPNLGEFHGYILADIPGLIEGASEGKGLGTKFLRHIKRTKILVHLVSFENSMSMGKVYKEIRNELKTYGDELDKKEEIIVLTKTDVVEDGATKLTTAPKLIAKKVKEFEKLKKPVYAISLYDDTSVKKFGDELVKLLRKK